MFLEHSDADRRLQPHPSAAEHHASSSMGAPAVTGGSTYARLSSFVPARQLGVRIRNLDGILILSGRRHLLQLSPTAVVIWAAIDGRQSMGRIAAGLAQASGRAHRDALDHVAGFIAELLADDIVVSAVSAVDVSDSWDGGARSGEL